MKRVIPTILILAMLISIIPITPMEAQARTSVKIGDYIQFGTYYGEPILWRVIDLDKDGDPMLYSERILTIKAFDARGNYHTEEYRQKYGSNEWEPSNIRQWLNSSEKSIKWVQNSPTVENIWDGHNSYADEKGFLADGNFTASERNAIKPVTHKVLLADIDKDKRDGGTVVHQYDVNIASMIQNYDTAYYKMIEDKVFFLSVKEIKELVYDRGWEGARKPTQKAVDNSTFKKSVSLNTRLYAENWMRSPYGYGIPITNPHAVRSVRGSSVSNNSAFSGWVGVCPALYLNLYSAIFKSGSGTKNNPYTITGIEGTGSKQTQALDPNDLNIYIAGKLSQFPDAKPFVDANGRTLVPVRFIAEQIGARVDWIASSQTVKITYFDIEFEMQIGSNKVYKKSKNSTQRTQEIMDTTPVLKENRTYVPLRWIAENLGYSVAWNDELRSIELIRERFRVLSVQ